MLKTRHAAVGFIAALIASSLTQAAPTERLVDQTSKGVKGIHIAGFKGQVTFIPTTDAKIIVDAKTKVDEALQSPWRPIIEVTADGWLQIIVNGPPSKADWRSLTIPALDLEVRSPSLPVQLIWKEGDVSFKDWKATVEVTSHRGRIILDGGKDVAKLSTLEGDVTVSNHQGRVKLDNYNAKVMLSQVEGSMQLENFSGHMTVDKSKGDISLRASKGRSEVRDHKGRLEFDLAQGDVSINNLEGAIRGQADQGQVTATIKGPADMKVRTDAAKVTVLVAKASGARVDLGTQDGNFSVTFPMRYDRIEKMKIMKGQLSGKDGGLIFVRTQSGDVRMKPL
jgi:hypothetical protein